MDLFVRCPTSFCNQPKVKVNHFAYFFNGDRTSRYPQPTDFVAEGVAFLNSSNLNGDVVDTSVCKYITEEKYNSLSGAKLQKGDIVYCLRGSVGKCAINTNLERGTVASSLTTIRPHDINGEYLLFCLLSDVAVRQTQVYMNGTCAANLSAENVSNYLIALPPHNEQDAIAKYAVNGILAKAENSRLEEKLQSAQKSAAVWKQRYESLKEQARPYLEAVKLAPEKVRAFLDAILTRTRQTKQHNQPSRRKSQDMEL